MKRVLKFQLNQPSEHVFSLELPPGAEFLTASYQGDTPQAWFLCPEWHDATGEMRIFLLVGTGWEIQDKGKWVYLSTLYLNRFVWHLFELVSE